MRLMFHFMQPLHNIFYIFIKSFNAIKVPVKHWNPPPHFKMNEMNELKIMRPYKSNIFMYSSEDGYDTNFVNTYLNVTDQILRYKSIL